jgi:16S rRNA (cytosine1402-N4)-methyltransferase
LAGQDARLSVVHASFDELGAITEREGVYGRVDAVLFDLGVSSPQLDDARRGFSFKQAGPLDMRMDPTSGVSAAAWLARVKERELGEVLRSLGEERYARRIARAVVEARKQGPVRTTTELAAIISRASPSRERSKHPATRAFQAIRMFINRELDSLASALAQVPGVLAPGGRLAVISFHSLEDRLVKRFIRGQARQEPEEEASLRPVGRPIFPSEAELAANPRARSAVLRVAERARR